MCLRGCSTHDQRRSDLGVGAPACQQTQDVDLSLAERFSGSGLDGTEVVDLARLSGTEPTMHGLGLQRNDAERVGYDIMELPGDASSLGGHGDTSLLFAFRLRQLCSCRERRGALVTAAQSRPECCGGAIAQRHDDQVGGRRTGDEHGGPQSTDRRNAQHPALRRVDLRAQREGGQGQRDRDRRLTTICIEQTQHDHHRESPVDYANDGSFLIGLLLSLTALVGLRRAIRAPRPPLVLIAVGPMAVGLGVLVGLIIGESPAWFGLVGAPGNLLAWIGMCWLATWAWRTRTLSRWVADLMVISVPVGVGFAEYGGSIVTAALWCYIGAFLVRRGETEGANRRNTIARWPVTLVSV